LEFLGLKDESSETELEEALIRRLETFLLELGGDFAFVGWQRRLRTSDRWVRRIGIAPSVATYFGLCHTHAAFPMAQTTH
jgi:hypothetical protein